MTLKGYWRRNKKSPAFWSRLIFTRDQIQFQWKSACQRVPYQRGMREWRAKRRWQCNGEQWKNKNICMFTFEHCYICIAIKTTSNQKTFKIYSKRVLFSAIWWVEDEKKVGVKITIRVNITTSPRSFPWNALAKAIKASTQTFCASCLAEST